MDLELRKELVRKFKPEVKELGKLLNKDLIIYGDMIRLDREIYFES